MFCTDIEIINKARKEHRCDWGGEVVEPGNAYYHYRYFDGPVKATVKEHPECYDAMLEVISQERGPIEFSFGDYDRGETC